jgi:hypothetical protein
MVPMLKAGDRVRLKHTAILGTVLDAPGTEPSGVRLDVTVEWDGREGSAAVVPLEKLEYVRPPPQAW